MKRITVLILVSLMLFSFYACSDTKTESSQTPKATESTAEVYNEYDGSFDGEALRILGKKPDYHAFAEMQWTGTEDERLSSKINSAAVERANRLKEKYGIDIEYYQSDEYYILEEVMKASLSGEELYDVVVDGLTTMATLSTGGYLQNISDAEHLDLEKSWWDQEVNKNLSIAGRLYYATGDIIITDDEYTYCTLFNKTLYDELSFAGSFDGMGMYELIESGGWTYDAMMTMGRAAMTDLNGDSQMIYNNDRWGVLSDNGCVQVLMSGSGYAMAQKNSEDIPELTATLGNASTIFASAQEIMNSDYNLNADKIPATEKYGECERAFGSGRAMFYLTKLNMISEMKKYEVSFGIAPIPKLTEAQGTYYNPAAVLHFSLVGIPSFNVKNFEMTCVALEYLAYQGKELIAPAYIEETLKKQRVEDDEDAEMIDYIISHRTYDIALMFNWAGATSFFNKFAGTGDSGFISAYESVEMQMQSDLEKTIEFYQS